LCHARTYTQLDLDKARTMERIANFAARHLPPAMVFDRKPTKQVQSFHQSEGTMLPRTRETLAKFFRPYSQQLMLLLSESGMDFVPSLMAAELGLDDDPRELEQRSTPNYI
jgi:hypothetical protein